MDIFNSGMKWSQKSSLILQVVVVELDVMIDVVYVENAIIKFSCYDWKVYHKRQLVITVTDHNQFSKLVQAGRTYLVDCVIKWAPLCKFYKLVQTDYIRGEFFIVNILKQPIQVDLKFG